jgi:hypothetical protein
VQLLDRSGASLVLRDLAARLLENFDDYRLVLQRRELSLKPRQQSSQDAVDMRAKGVPGFVDETDFRDMLHAS